MINVQYINIEEACQITGLTRRSIYNMEKKDFPARLKLNSNKNVPIYNKTEVQEWSRKYNKDKKQKNSHLYSDIYDQIMNEIMA